MEEKMLTVDSVVFKKYEDEIERLTMKNNLLKRKIIKEKLKTETDYEKRRVLQHQLLIISGEIFQERLEVDVNNK